MAATRWMPRGIWWVAAALLLAANSASFAAEPMTEQFEFFEKKIRPVLVQHCYKCHAEGDDLKGGLRVDTKEGLLRGGNSGPAVMPGKPEESQLIFALEYETVEMPPSRKLPADVISDFVRWIKMGAPDPRVTVEASVPSAYKIDLEAARRHWAFQPPVTHAAPAVRNQSWPLDDVDRFVLARLESMELAPSADADRGTWLRRVTLDLTGLLPTPEEQRAFEADNRADAYAAVVDRLLASPRFGERWGRHWLDVARYGDSTGKERNAPYPQAWLYRNWVIDATSADKPYDQFLREQLAGDLLPAAAAQERRRLLTATGFLAVGIKSVNETIPDAYLLDIVDEQIDVVGRSMLGLSIACARCHDHKFDPIPTKDYYAVAGIFGSTEVLDGVIRRPRVSSRVDRLMLTTAPGQTGLSKAFAEFSSLEGEWTKTHQELGRVRHKFPEQVRQLRFERRHLETSLEEAAQSIVEGAGASLVMAVADRSEPVDMAVRVRGETFAIGTVVPRGVLSILSNVPAAAMPKTGSGRLELADWIAHRDNPLTARVAVNRVWAHLFGEGLVATGDDFGLQGQRPTHPELLDTLAVGFMEDGWSLKRLVRRLVLSRTYRQSSAEGDGRHVEADGDNRQLWRFSRRRLESEAIRDVMMSASGQLVLDRPNTSLMLQFGTTELESDTDIGSLVRKSPYRSVYLPMPRGLLPEMLRIFDQADPSLVVTQRDATGSPPQALFLMNSPFVIEQARHLARRLLAECQADSARVELAYRLTMARAPTAAERRTIDVFLAENDSGNGQASEESWTTIAQTLLALPEFRFVL